MTTRSEQVEALGFCADHCPAASEDRRAECRSIPCYDLSAALEAKPAAEPCPTCGGSGDSGYRGGGGVLETARRKCPLCNGTGIIRGNWCDGEPDAPCVCIKPAAEVMDDELAESYRETAEMDREIAAEMFPAVVDAMKRLDEEEGAAEVTDEAVRRLRDRICQMCTGEDETSYSENCRRLGSEHDCWVQAIIDDIEARLSETERLNVDGLLVDADDVRELVLCLGKAESALDDPAFVRVPREVLEQPSQGTSGEFASDLLREYGTNGDADAEV